MAVLYSLPYPFVLNIEGFNSERYSLADFHRPCDSRTGYALLVHIFGLVLEDYFNII